MIGERTLLAPELAVFEEEDVGRAASLDLGEGFPREADVLAGEGGDRLVVGLAVRLVPFLARLPTAEEPIVDIAHVDVIGGPGRLLKRGIGALAVPHGPPHRLNQAFR